jgi:HEPN domain-containing protein
VIDTSEKTIVQHTSQFIIYAGEYMLGATRLYPAQWLPVVQLAGHAVELSLKACLVSENVWPPKGEKGHDLAELCKQVRGLRFKLENKEIAQIVDLQQLYLEDMTTRTKYKARYPAMKPESLGTSSFQIELLKSIVQNLCKQAKERAERSKAKP